MKKTRTQLAALFKNGSVPTASNFVDVFDSFVNLVDTTVQRVESDVAAKAVVSIAELSVLTSETSPRFYGEIKHNSFASFAASAHIVTPIYTVAASISAAGSAQNTAFPLAKRINVISGGANNQGVLSQATTGQSQFVVNRTANNIFLYPATGATINDLAVNTPFTVSGLKSAKLTYSLPTQAFTTYYGAAIPVTAGPNLSINFAGGNQALTKNNAQWGAYNRAKFAIAGSFYSSIAASGGITPIMARVSGSDSEFILRHVPGGGSNYVDFSMFVAGGAPFGFIQSNTNSAPLGQWNSFLVNVNVSAAVTADRLKMYINNSPQLDAGTTIFPSSALPSVVVNTDVGRGFIGLDQKHFNGRIYSLAFFSSANPTPSQIFNGSAGNVRDFTGYDGLYMYLNVSATVTHDGADAVHWTNVNGVTSSSAKPS